MTGRHNKNKIIKGIISIEIINPNKILNGLNNSFIRIFLLIYFGLSYTNILKNANTLNLEVFALYFHFQTSFKYLADKTDSAYKLAASVGKIYGPRLMGTAKFLLSISLSSFVIPPSGPIIKAILVS